MSHSPEPWFVDTSSHLDDGKADIHFGKPEYSDFGGDAHVPLCVSPVVTAHKLDLSESDARRIVACVNFCQGLPTSVLEGGMTAQELIGGGAEHFEGECDE